MLEKQKQPETYIVINDTSQRSRVATLFGYGETFSYFATNLLLSMFCVKSFNISQS